MIADRTPRRQDLESIELASRDEIGAVQLGRLRQTLERVYANVPHYRRRFDETGVHPETLRSLDDISRFPFTTKEDLRLNYPYGLLAVPRQRLARIHASSGTTGTPTIVGYTRQDLDVWADVMARSIRAAGGRPGDIVHVAYGYGLFTGGLGAHDGATRLGCTVIPVSGGMTERQVRLIVDLQPQVIMVTPSYMLAIADEMERQGVHARGTSLEVGIFGAEPWTEEMRSEIEARLAMHAVDIYGLSEVMGPGVAQECIETKDGLHVWEDHFYPEIIDPVTEQPLAEGEMGELVLTSLTKEAMPVIRYRTRDLTRLLPGTARSMRRIDRITGRTDDMIILRGVNLFPTQVEELILRIPGLAAHFELVLSRPRHLDEMTVRVEARPGSASAAERQAMAGLLARSIKDAIGLTTSVDVVEPGLVERSLGKARRIVDLRKA